MSRKLERARREISRLKDELRRMEDELRRERCRAANLEQEMGAWRKAFLATEGAEAARSVVEGFSDDPLLTVPQNTAA